MATPHDGIDMTIEEFRAGSNIHQNRAIFQLCNRTQMPLRFVACNRLMVLAGVKQLSKESLDLLKIALATSVEKYPALFNLEVLPFMTRSSELPF